MTGQDQAPLTINLSELFGDDSGGDGGGGDGGGGRGIAQAMGAAKTYKVRDIWKHADLPSVTTTLTTDEIESGDSRFYLLTPDLE